MTSNKPDQTPAQSGRRSMSSIRPARPQDLPGLRALISKDGLFAPDEVSTALELIVSALSDPERSGDYRVLVATPDGADIIVGYVCYGPTPMTEGTWDLYWIATDPDHRGQGVAGALCRDMEAEIRQKDGRLVRVETSHTDNYGDAHRFYERRGYPEVARIPDFYRPGDDLITMVKRLS